MPNNLPAILSRLGITHKARYTVEEVAEILGIRRDQVIDLLKRQKLIGMRSTGSRWSGVFFDELNSYLETIHSPRKFRGMSEGHRSDGILNVSGQPSVPPVYFQEDGVSMLNTPTPAPNDPESRERILAEEFVRKLSSLPIARTVGRWISSLELMKFYDDLTNLDDPYFSETLWRAISHAIEEGTTVSCRLAYVT